MTRILPFLILLAFGAAPGTAHDWAGIGDSRFGAVEAVVPFDWRDMDSTGAASESLGTAAHDLARFQDELRAGFPVHRARSLTANGVATVLGVQDFEQNRRRWSDALAAAVVGNGGLRLAAPETARTVSLGPWTYKRTAGVSAALDF